MNLTEKDRDFMSRVPIFAGLSSESLDRLAALARRVDFPTQSLVYQEGEPAREMFIVLAGKLDVSKQSSKGAPVSIATLSPGDVGGEMALIDIQPRSAAIRASEATTLAVLMALLTR